MNGTATGTDVAELPSTLNDLELWLDGSDSTTLFADTSFTTSATSSVAGWKDKSGNNNHAQQSTSTKRPTYDSTGTNGKSVVNFDGSNDFVSSTTVSVTQPYTFGIVAKTNNNSSGRDFLFDGHSGSNRSIIALDNSGTVQMWANNWGDSGINTPFWLLFNGRNFQWIG